MAYFVCPVPDPAVMRRERAALQGAEGARNEERRQAVLAVASTELVNLVCIDIRRTHQTYARTVKSWSWRDLQVALVEAINHYDPSLITGELEKNIDQLFSVNWIVACLERGLKGKYPDYKIATSKEPEPVLGWPHTQGWIDLISVSWE
jgi:hypothetical protein